MHDIETLIAHFLSVSWGPVIPPGESLIGIEATKGNNGYYLISDGSTMPYRVRIRSPSFPHMQTLPATESRSDDSRSDGDPWEFGLCPGGRRSLSEKRRWQLALCPGGSMLTEEIKHEIETEMHHYPRKQAVCIEALKVIQRHRGWISDESLRELAEFLEMTPDELDSVATFYNKILRRPVGTHVIWICDSVSCWIMGYDSLRERLTQLLGNKTGRDQRRRALHIVAKCLPWRVRSRAGIDDRTTIFIMT